MAAIPSPADARPGYPPAHARRMIAYTITRNAAVHQGDLQVACLMRSERRARLVRLRASPSKLRQQEA